MKAKTQKWLFRLLTLFTLLQVCIALRFCVFTPCTMPSYSMAPTLIAGDRMIASQCIPGRRVLEEVPERPGHYHVERRQQWRKVQTGDVVVFNYPYAQGEERMLLTYDQYFCKRCAGVPGDTCLWKRMGTTHSLYLPRRGERLAIDSLNLPDYARCIEYETGQMPEIRQGVVVHADSVMETYTFQGNYYFMLGDNTNDSYDSRFWGAVHEDFLLGVVLFTWFSKDPETGEVRWRRMFRGMKGMKNEK